MTLENRIIQTKDGEKYIEGYFLTIEQLEELANYFTVSDPMDFKMFNVKQHILHWLKKQSHE